MARSNQEARWNEVREFILRAERFWEPRRRAMTKKARFLIDGLHYDDDHYDQFNADSEEIRWSGNESFHVWRHEVAEVCDTPTALSARPLEQGGDDPDVVEQGVSLMEGLIESPDNDCEDVFEGMVGCASAVGYGVIGLEVAPGDRWGRAIGVEIDPRDFDWDPSVKSPFSPLCRWVRRRVRLTRKQALDRCGKGTGKWKASVVAKLAADEGFTDEMLDPNGENGQVPFVTRNSGQAEGEQWSEDDEITFYMIWEHEPEDTKQEDDADSFEEFDEGDRYMACASCGHTSVRQRSRKDGREYPESLPCPDCGEDSHRIDGTMDRNTILKYPEGKLTVIAPLGGIPKFVYEGEWEVPCRAYPFTFLSRFRHPFRVTGPSLANLLYWNQTATDMVMRVALERMMIGGVYWMVPDGARVVDADRNPWQFTPENGNAMYYTGDSMPAVQLLEGTGIPSSWSVLYNTARAGLVDKTGIADFGISEGQSRNIPASSVSQQIQQQEIPTAHFKRRYQRARGRFVDLLYDYHRFLNPDTSIVRMKGRDGTDRVVEVRPSAMPALQFYVQDAPDFRSIDQARKDAFDSIVQIVEQRPWALKLAASVYGFPMSMVRQAQQDLTEWKQEQQAPSAPAGAVPQPPGAATPQPAPAAPGGQAPPSAVVDRLLSTLYGH